MPTSAPASRAFSSPAASWMPPVAASDAPDAAVQEGDPPQRHRQLGGRAQVELRLRLQGIQVDVGLEEAVEQHQAVGARLGQPHAHVAHGAEVRPHLDRQRNRDRLLHAGHEVQVAGLPRRGWSCRGRRRTK